MQARLRSRPRAAGAEGSRRGPQEPLHQLLQLRTPQGFAEKVAGAGFRCALFHLELQGFEEEPGEAPDGGAVVDDQHGARQRVPPRKYRRKREPFSARRPNRQTSHSAQIYGIRTIFPTTRSFSRSSWARAASARGYVFAITGRSSPRSKRGRTRAEKSATSRAFCSALGVRSVEPSTVRRRTRSAPMSTVPLLPDCVEMQNSRP